MFICLLTFYKCGLSLYLVLTVTFFLWYDHDHFGNSPASLQGVEAQPQRMMVIVHLRFIMLDALFNALFDMLFHSSFSFSSCMIDMRPYWHHHFCAVIRFSAWRLFRR